MDPFTSKNVYMLLDKEQCLNFGVQLCIGIRLSCLMKVATLACPGCK